MRLFHWIRIYLDVILQRVTSNILPTLLAQIRDPFEPTKESLYDGNSFLIEAPAARLRGETEGNYPFLFPAGNGALNFYIESGTQRSSKSKLQRDILRDTLFFSYKSTRLIGLIFAV